MGTSRLHSKRVNQVPTSVINRAMGASINFRGAIDKNCLGKTVNVLSK